MNFSYITWLDDKGHAKPPMLLYFMLAFLARGWCVFIMSLTQMSDRAGLVKLIYPEKEAFLMALLSGAGAALLYGLVLVERRRSPTVLMKFFAQAKSILWFLVVVDGAILLQRVIDARYMFNWSFGLDAVCLFWCSLYLLKSKRLAFYLEDWR